MKKHSFLIFAVILIAAMILSSCQAAGGGDETVDWSKVVPATEITWWHQHSGDREIALAEIIDEFNSTNGYGITMTAEYAGGYGDIFTKMLPILNTTEVPDLVVGYQNQVATYQLADAMWDLNEIIDDPDWGMPKEDQDDFFEGFFSQDVFPMFGNARLALPPKRSMEVLYYNIDWLAELGYDAPPTTPAEFKEMACAAVAQSFSGATAEGSMGYQLSIDTSRFASWTFAFGGNIFDYDTSQFTLDDPAAVEAWEFLQDLFAEGCATIVTESYGDQTDFGAGRLLFTVGSSSGLPYYDSAVSEGANFDWSVAAIPYTTAEPVMNIYGASIGIPKSTPERQLAAWIFLKFFTRPDIQAQWAAASGYFPTRASVAENMEEYFEANPVYATGFDLLEYGIFEPPVPGYDFVRDEIEIVMAAIVDDPTLDVAAALAELNIKANEILAEQMAQIEAEAE